MLQGKLLKGVLHLFSHQQFRKGTDGPLVRVHGDAQFTGRADALLRRCQQRAFQSLDHLGTVDAFLLLVVFEQGFDFANHDS